MKRKVLLRLALVTATAILASCAADDPLDPTGTWATTVTFGAGDCGATGSIQDAWTVTKTTGGYEISSSDPNQSISGTFTCDPDQCKLSAQIVETGTLGDGTPFTANIAYNYTLDAEDEITGSGTASLTPQGGSSCTQSFTAAGTKS